MPKQGPCCHCGITSTPLWRNGPPGKPVLCNACGSRWRTKGTLANYAPLHSRGFVPIDSEVCRNSQEHKSVSNTKPQSLQITNQNEGDIEFGEIVPGNESSAIGFEDDTSHRSSSGSALSFSESSVLLGSMDGNDISGSAQSHLWDSHIPSRKRTSYRCHIDNPSPVEKLRRDLYDILQEQESTYLSGSVEEVLLFERKDQMLSVETDLGSVLIKQPASSAEEESEASSRIIGNEVHYLNDSHMGSSFIGVPSQSCEVSSSPRGRRRVLPGIEEGEEMKEHPVKRRALADISLENILLINVDVLQSKHLPQRSINLKSTKDEDFKLEEEILSSSSQIVGGATLPTKKPLGQSQYKASGVTKGSMKARNHGSTILHPLQGSSSTNRVFRKGLMPTESRDHMQVVLFHSSASLSTSSLNGSSTILDSMKAAPSSSDASCPPGGPIRKPVASKRAYLQ